MDMHCLVLISCCWLLKKTLVITTNLTNPESASDDIKKIEVIKKFKKTLIRIIRTKENFVFGVSDIYGVKLFTRLRLNFSHLNKFRHNFNDTINPMCNCGAATETTVMNSCVADFIKFKEWSSLMTYIN